eukprot:TRINITY_DN17158_c0_g1_i2.p1 TRINITY_DN17158_c0_g1~~TRINITY_DN17158_c0_g1_i2.p1  ORF type:complete len:1088 (-),score=248.60 TRINITY_DN17158_c0_g1_i2:31-3294(-)
MLSLDDFWKSSLTDSRIFQETSIRLPSVSGPAWPVLDKEAGKRAPLKAYEFWGDVVLDLPQQQYAGRRTPAAVCRCGFEMCIFCQQRDIHRGSAPSSRTASRADSRRADSRREMRETPATRAGTPGTPRAVTPRTPRLTAEGWGRDLLPEQISARASPSPYAPLPEKRPARKQARDEEGQRFMRRCREEGWQGDPGQNSLSRRYIENNMPVSGAILREDTVRGYIAAEEAEEPFRAMLRRQKVHKFVDRVHRHQDKGKWASWEEEEHADALATDGLPLLQQAEAIDEHSSEQDSPSRIRTTLSSGDYANVPMSTRHSVMADKRISSVSARFPDGAIDIPPSDTGVQFSSVADLIMEEEEPAAGMKHSDRMRRIAKLAKVALKTGTALKTPRELVRIALQKESVRLGKSVLVQDARLASESFDFYDEDKSGTLELGEIRAVLEDLGLLPVTDEEKAGIRQTLVNFVSGVQDGYSDSEEDLDPDEKKSKEDIARSIMATKDQMPDLITRVRKRLQACRKKMYDEVFNRYDVMDEGEVDLMTIFKMLQEDLKLMPNIPEDISDFCIWLNNVVKSAMDPSWSAEERFDTIRRKGSLWLMPSVSVEKAAARAKRADANVQNLKKRFSVQPGGTDDSIAGLAEGDVTHEDTQVSSASQRQASSEEEESDNGSFHQAIQQFMTPFTLCREIRHGFGKQEFEVLIQFLGEAHGRNVAEQQGRVAKENGLSNPGLFQEFRKDLEEYCTLFKSMDDQNTGVLNKTELWVILNKLGLLPTIQQDKIMCIAVIGELCKKASVTSALCRNHMEAPRPLSWTSARIALKSLTDSSVMADSNDPYLSDIQAGVLDIEGFLELISKVRQYKQQQMREELAPLYDRVLRRRKNSGADGVIGVAEVSMALEELDMAPQRHEHQLKLSEFLSDVNEWGFQPLTIDFEAFVRFIGRVREWRATHARAEDTDYALRVLNLPEKLVGEYRVVFDIVDSEGDGELDIAAVRKAVSIMRYVSSDELRVLFNATDRDGSGSVNFCEFLHMIRELDPKASNKSRLKKTAGMLITRMHTNHDLLTSTVKLATKEKDKLADQAAPTADRLHLELA